jgi:hypothetical protein
LKEWALVLDMRLSLGHASSRNANVCKKTLTPPESAVKRTNNEGTGEVRAETRG